MNRNSLSHFRVLRPLVAGTISRYAIGIVLAGLLAGWAHGFGSLEPFRNRLVEARFEALPRAPTGQVLLVEIDAKSIAAIGQWPWPRRIHADVIRALVRLGAAEIAFDVDFSARSMEIEDAAFEAALRETQGSVILAAFNQRLSADPRDNRVVSTRPIERLREHSWLASVNVEPDPDGRVRRYPYGVMIEGEFTPSIAAMFAQASKSGESFLIDFGIAAAQIERISAIDLLQGQVAPERVAGRKILIGAAAIELRDFFQVPSYGIIPGALVQALAAETLLQGRALQATGGLTTAAGLIGLAMVFIAARQRLRWRALITLAAGASMLLEGSAAALQAVQPILVDTSAWHTMLVGVAVVTVLREIDMRRILLTISTTESRNSQTLLDQVIADNFDGIVVVDDNGLIHSASHAAIKTFDPHERESWIGRPVADLVPLEFARALMQVIGDGGNPSLRDESPQELTIIVTGIPRILEYVITPSHLAGGLRIDGSARPDRVIACLTFRDITERRLAEKRLAYLARFDTLTELPNRNHFIERLSEILNGTEPSCTILYIDLDRFKTVNDTLGHPVGDLLLHAVARRCLEIVPPPHLLARLGGDEFAVIHEGSASDDALRQLAEHLIARMSEPFEVSGHRLAVGASIGVARLGPAAGDLSTVMKNADTALYHAKRSGGGTLCFFDMSMDVALQARQKLEVALRDAMEREEFEVAYQPQFDIASRQLIGVEALLRWHHPERGPVSPAEFVPVAEEIGLMEQLGEWVLRRACADAAAWPRRIKLAVNVSPSQFTRGNLVEDVARALRLSGLAANRLELEITESLFLQEEESIRTIMETLSRQGITFALDDFGTGYSSLNYIRKFPISKIKIDRSFVSGLPHDRESIAIIQAVIALAANLGLRTNAEGLETMEQVQMLCLLGCTEGQGYGLGRPQPAAEILRLLKKEPDQISA